MGIERDEDDALVPMKNGNGLYQRMQAAATPEEKDAILRSYLDLIKDLPQRDGASEKVKDMESQQTLQSYLWKKKTYTDSHGNVLGTYIEQITLNTSSGITTFLDPVLRRQAFEDAWRTDVEYYTPGSISTQSKYMELPGHPEQLVNETTEIISGRYIGDQGFGKQGDLSQALPYHAGDFVPISRAEAKDLSYRSLTDPSLAWVRQYGEEIVYYYNKRPESGLGMMQESIVRRYMLPDHWRPEGDS